MRPNSSKPSSDAGSKTICVFLTSTPAQRVLTLHQDCKLEKESASKHAQVMFECSGDHMRLIEKQAALACQQTFLTERHRAPNGVPAQAKTWVGDEGTQSPAIGTEPAALPPFPLRSVLSTYGQPKKLSERLQWMADNLPGFQEEMDLVDEIQRSAPLKGI